MVTIMHTDPGFGFAKRTCFCFASLGARLGKLCTSPFSSFKMSWPNSDRFERLRPLPYESTPQELQTEMGRGTQVSPVRVPAVEALIPEIDIDTAWRHDSAKEPL